MKAALVLAKKVAGQMKQIYGHGVVLCNIVDTSTAKKRAGNRSQLFTLLYAFDQCIIEAEIM